MLLGRLVEAGAVSCVGIHLHLIWPLYSAVHPMAFSKEVPLSLPNAKCSFIPGATHRATAFLGLSHFILDLQSTHVFTGVRPNFL